MAVGVVVVVGLVVVVMFKSFHLARYALSQAPSSYTWCFIKRHPDMSNRLVLYKKLK